MRYAILILGFLFLSVPQAFAVCSGGLDGKNAAFSGCSEMGELGDLIYERDQTGRVLRKRSEGENKQYLIQTVEERFKNRGVTMKNKDGEPVITINRDNVVFDVFNQNGDKIYTYTVDVEKGIPQNEKDVIEARNQYDSAKAQRKEVKRNRMKRLEALAEKIQAEQDEKKAVTKQ